MTAAALKLRLPSQDEQNQARLAFRQMQAAPAEQKPVKIVTPQGVPLELPSDAAQLLIDRSEERR